MAQCSYHPDVETEIRCVECGRYICPREWIETPVGYKCPEDGRPPRSATVHLKPNQLVGALAMAAVAGIAGALLLGAFSGGFFSLILGFIWGGLTAEAVHRGSGGHRGGAVTAIAIAAVVFGWLVAIGLDIALPLPYVRAPGLFTVILAVVGAAGDTASWRMRR